MRTYRELIRLHTFQERFDYLKLHGVVGRATFGHDRYINQRFYTSREWRQLRHHIIARDFGRDLGIDGYEIFDKIIIHHINPIGPEEIVHNESSILDPDQLITTTHQTHNAIHYGDENLLPHPFKERSPGDTRLW